jgi:H+-transporting ATPase
MMFLQLVTGGHLMLFVTRTREALWKPPYPNPKLFFAIVATQIAAVFMCSQGWLVRSIPWSIIGFVWGYNLIWMIVQDVVKLGLYGILDPARSWKSSLFQSLRVPMTRRSETIH